MQLTYIMTLSDFSLKSNYDIFSICLPLKKSCSCSFTSRLKVSSILRLLIRCSTLSFLAFYPVADIAFLIISWRSYDKSSLKFSKYKIISRLGWYYSFAYINNDYANCLPWYLSFRILIYIVSLLPHLSPLFK